MKVLKLDFERFLVSSGSENDKFWPRVISFETAWNCKANSRLGKLNSWKKSNANWSFFSHNSLALSAVSDNLYLKTYQRFLIDRPQLIWTTFSENLNLWFEAFSFFSRHEKSQFSPFASVFLWREHLRVSGLLTLILRCGTRWTRQ